MVVLGVVAKEGGVCNINSDPTVWGMIWLKCGVATPGYPLVEGVKHLRHLHVLLCTLVWYEHQNDDNGGYDCPC